MAALTRRAEENVEKRHKTRAGYTKRVEIEKEKMRRQHMQKETVPWADEYADVLEAHVPGFSLYAEEKSKNCTPVSNFDLMIWAICCGAPHLAVFLWKQSDSPSARR